MPASPTFDELIFENRLKAYGAFDLRRNYRPTLTHAVWVGVGLFLSTLAIPTLYTRIWPNGLLNDKPREIVVELTKLPDIPAEKPVPLPPVEAPPAVNTVRNLPLVVLPEADVVEEALPPTTDELADATSGEQTAEGTGDVEVIEAPEAATSPTAEEEAIGAEKKPEEIFLNVEQQPQYPGGPEGLKSYLEKNLRYPAAASRAGMSGKVFVSFVVNTDGSLTDIQVLKGIGFGCDEEALRVIRQMPHWKPGKQSGRAVRVKFNLPITFALE